MRMASPIYISVTFCHRKGGREGVECLQIAFLFGHKCPHFSAHCLLVKTAILLEMIEIEMIQIAWTIIHTILKEAVKKNRTFYGQADRKGGGGVSPPRPCP